MSSAGETVIRDTERPDPGLSLTPHLLIPCPVPFALLPLSSQREPAAQQGTFLLLMQLGPQLCIPQQSRGHPTLNHGLFVTPLFSFCAPHHPWTPTDCSVTSQQALSHSSYFL
ncbi:hypothetical protein ACRRTK_007401 [Alexandromys fortis]